jgi:hypothetical protein
MRIVIVIKRVGPGQYQAQLRKAAGGNHLFYSRREDRTSGAKRAAEKLFGPLEWQEPPAALKRSEPEVNQVAYYNA